MVYNRSKMQSFAKVKGRPLHEQVREHLRLQCQLHSEETALPSLRQLSEEFGVNHITISRAMRELEGEGVLRIIPGKGTFVASAPTSQQCIEMITLLTPRQYLLDTSRHTFKGMQDGLGPAFTVSGTTLMVPPLPRHDTLMHGLRSRQVAAAALFGFGYLPYPDSFYEAEFIHHLAEEMPVVLVGKEHSLLRLDAVFCDPAPQMKAYLEECHQNGLRHFSYLGVDDAQTHLQHRVAAFQEFLLSKGLQWLHAPAEASPNLALVHSVLDSKPEVVVVSTSVRAHELVLEAQRRGLQPGTDFQILCFAGSAEEVRPIASYVNVILLEEEEVGRCVVHRLLGRLSGADKPSPLTRRVPGRLVRAGKLKFHESLDS